MEPRGTAQGDSEEPGTRAVWGGNKRLGRALQGGGASKGGHLESALGTVGVTVLIFRWGLLLWSSGGRLDRNQEFQLEISTKLSGGDEESLQRDGNIRVAAWAGKVLDGMSQGGWWDHGERRGPRVFKISHQIISAVVRHFCFY